MFALGKKPATRDKRDLRFTEFRVAKKLPTPPRQFGHEKLVGADWGVLANDQVGDCVFAGGCHEHMLWCASAKTATAFTDRNALEAYSAVTGYNGSPDSDQGTDVRDALKYRQETGLTDAAGKVHKIGAYVALQPGNLDHLYQALYLFGAVGIGIEFPGSAMDQTDAGKPWSVVKRATIDGGHYVPLVARRDSLVCVTWGRLQSMTTGFYKRYTDEAWGILSEDMLTEGKSLEGFDLPALRDALKEL